MIGADKENELVKAIDDRIEYLRNKHENASAYAQTVGFFEGVLPLILNENQADEIIKRLNHRTTRKVAS